jgi:RNA polymerase sigma factor (sigma-70 family)
MASHRTNAMSGVLVRALRPAADGATDGNLLGAFIDRRDPAAFAELVRRHGPMVLGVCSRVLGNVHDAEDAFQATFLVLARKAGSVSPRNGVGNWLYGVAHQTAVRVRAITMKRRGRESLVSVPEPAVPDPGWDDLAAVLDEELGRLPDHYRAVIVLCDVEGRTRPDAAAHLGCPEGSVSSRLSRARAMLARRLARRGVTLSAGALALLVSQNASSARVPTALLQTTVESTLTGTSPAIASITDGVMRAMLIKKLKTVALAAVAVGVVGLSGIIGLDRSGGQDPSRPAVPEPTVPVSFAPVPKASAPKDDAAAILGTWTVVDFQQVSREPTKEEREAWKAGKFTITFTAEKMVFNTDESDGHYRLDPAQQPRAIEWLEGGRVIARGIYDLAGNDLKICMGREADKGEEAEPPIDFDLAKRKPGTFPTLFVLKRSPLRKVEYPPNSGEWWTLLLAGREDIRPATRATIPERYDFRESVNYKGLPADQREKLEQVTRDFVLLWGALDLCARDHKGTMPAKLEDLVPRYLKDLPRDPFATKATADEKKLDPYTPSLQGLGYRYRPGRADSFVLMSVGLADFPYLAEKGNVGLYIARGTWISGREWVPQEIPK